MTAEPTDDRLLQEYLEHATVRLFVSIDLVGSTSLKKLASERDEVPWVVTFERFYREFPKQLLASYTSEVPRYCDKQPFRSDLRPAVFKVLGDEILFHVEVTRHEQTLYHLHVMKETVKRFNDSLRERHKFLQCKPTAWLAGFPVTNTEVQIPNSDGSSTADYIGPSMDIGFRLTKLSSPRRFVVSLELAIMITDASLAAKKTGSRPRIFYEGNELLAGVLNGLPYPIIWVDLFESSPIDERLLGIDRQPCNLSDLRDYCYQFRERNGLPRCFIKGDPHPDYHGPDNPNSDCHPVNWVERYRNIKLKREKYGLDITKHLQ